MTTITCPPTELTTADAMARYQGCDVGDVVAGRDLLTRLGLLVPAGAEHLCRCGGYLARLVGGLVHVDVCDADLDPRRAGDCDRVFISDGTVARSGHKICTRPEAVRCDHDRCHAPADVNAAACVHGGPCCGSCCDRSY